MARAVERDSDFAQHLDLNCTNCIRGYADNAPQLNTLSSRAKTHRQEKRVLSAFTAACKRCFKYDRGGIESITSVYSCTYR